MANLWLHGSGGTHQICPAFGCKETGKSTIPVTAQILMLVGVRSPTTRSRTPTNPVRCVSRPPNKVESGAANSLARIVSGRSSIHFVPAGCAVMSNCWQRSLESHGCGGKWLNGKIRHTHRSNHTSRTPAGRCSSIRRYSCM